MKVIYHVHTYFLDNAIEVINALKNQVELHVYIEVSPESSKSTIIHIEKHFLDGKIVEFKNVVDNDTYEKLKKTLDGVKSCKAIMYKGKRTYSLQNIFTNLRIKKEFELIQPDIIHFDTISNRCIWIYPFLKKYTTVATLHDPVPHSGEGSWTQRFSKKFFDKISKGYFFHSHFAENLYIHSTMKGQKISFQIGMKPYGIISSYVSSKKEENEYILYFGRISPYKGIDMLLKAIPNVWKAFPDEQFVFVGKNDGNLKMDSYTHEIKITYIDRYVETQELVKFILKAKFIVCPYRDATQSGVLMTSFALNKPVVATRVGAFPEFIEDGINGKLCNPDSESISNAICYALKNENYIQWSKHLKVQQRKTDSFGLISNYYSSLLNRSK